MIRIAREAYEVIVSHAREGAPEEVCGVLGGERGETATVERALRAENAADAPRTRYELDPAEQFELMERIEDAGAVVVGFYHSHPGGPAGPSATDAAQATWEGYSYVVCSLSGEPSVGSWRWTGEEFRREGVIVGG